MDKLNAEKAAKLGDLLFRYMRARCRFQEKVEQPLPGHELGALIAQGKREFDEIYIEPNANPPIALDGKAEAIFEAIMKKNYHSLPFWEPQLLAAWRHYVISNGPLPQQPQPRGSNKTKPTDEPPNPPLAA
jgi:hypothetical protein